ncbi:hypothetical protein shn_18055 [Shinella sp. HZN7]|nr:hypothetical protein shn_18055 [Shinella sp. HZN7]
MQLRAEASLWTVFQGQAPAEPLRREVGDREPKATSHRGLVATAIEPLANLGQFVFRYSRSAVIDRQCDAVAFKPHSTMDRAFNAGMQNGIFHEIPRRKHEH